MTLCSFVWRAAACGSPFGMAAPAASAPSSGADLVDTATAGNFQTLVMALKAAGLTDTLKVTGPFTVFAPSDEAFNQLPPDTLRNLLKPENKSQLRSVLLYHVVPGKVVAAALTRLNTIKTAEGRTIAVATVSGDLLLNNARVTKRDLAASNGVIHVVDRVLLPESPLI